MADKQENMNPAQVPPGGSLGGLPGGRGNGRRPERRPEQPGQHGLADRSVQVHRLRQLRHVLRAGRLGRQVRPRLCDVRLLRSVHRLLRAGAQGAGHRRREPAVPDRGHPADLRRRPLLRVHDRRAAVHRLRQVRQGLQGLRQRLALPPGASRPLQELQRVRDRGGLSLAGVRACARRPAVLAQEEWTAKNDTLRLHHSSSCMASAGPVPGWTGRDAFPAARIRERLPASRRRPSAGGAAGSFTSMSTRPCWSLPCCSPRI